MLEMAITMSDIAKHTGSSISSVSAALKGNRSTAKVSEKKRREILKAAKQLGYRPSHAARTLKIGRTNVIGMVIGEIHTPHYGEMTSLLMEEAEKYGYSIQIYVTNWESERAVKALELLLGGRCDGILMYEGCMSEENRRQFKYLEKNKIPMVMLANPIKGFAHVGEEWNSGYIEIAEYIRLKGISSAVFLGDSVDNLERPKLKSMVDVFEKYGLELDMIECHNNPDYVYDFGRDFRSLINPPQMILTENDTLANALLKGLSEAGVKVPHEVGIIGYNNTNFSKFSNPALTTVGFDKIKFIRQAIKMLVKMIENNTITREEYYLPTYLVKRDSA